MQYDRANVIRNLEDAGCAPDFIIRFMDCLKKGEKEMQLKLLTGYRFSLLERIHEEEKKIACLDYFIYQIKKSNIE